MKQLSTLICMLLIYVHAISTPFSKKELNPTSGIEQITSNLYVIQGATPVMLDAGLTQYDPSYSNTIDGMDARKMSNFSENLGMLRGTTVLVVERRLTIYDTDTIFYKMWNMQQRPYQLEFITSNLDHPGLTGFLEDSYLNTSTTVSLNGKTNLNFSVTSDPSSKATNRFRLVFKSVSAGALPLTFLSLKAARNNKDILLNWATANESNLLNYHVQRSADGTAFTSISNIEAHNLSQNQYNWADATPYTGINYYRISVAEKDGKIAYSPIVTILNDRVAPGLTIYPNPIINGEIHLRVTNQPAGDYNIRLMNHFGQVVFEQKIKHDGSNKNYEIHPGRNIAAGIYQVEMSSPATNKISVPIVY